jgi:hypothetical protein
MHHGENAVKSFVKNNTHLQCPVKEQHIGEWKNFKWQV